MINIVLKNFDGRATISFKPGREDNYMVTINKKPPLDTHFLRFFSAYSAYRDKETTWQAIKNVAQQIDRQTEDLSSFKSPKFPDTKMSYDHVSNEARRKLKLLVEEVFFHAYAACLIAEERKSDRYAETTNSPRLGKRIKLLAAYQFLFEGLSVESAANFSRDKKAWQIDQECKKRGI